MKQVATLTVLAAMLLSAGIASGVMLTPVAELHNLVESGTDRLGRSVDMAGGSFNDNFGMNVDLEDGVLLVACQGDDAGFTGSGSAFLFDATTGGHL